MSGSTNKADIAERRKLEAQLYESRESLNDTYYDHAKNAQNEALDSEAQAYEESMNKFIEGLRISLEEATAKMDEFLMGVTSMVMYNADTILAKYEETNLPLTAELTNPWIKAKEAVGNYSGNALDLMNQWTREGGFFAQFNANGTTNLTSPWSAGTNAANAFKSSVATAMDRVVSNINSNVQTASTALSNLYKQIQDTEARAASAKLSGSGSGSGGGSTQSPPPTSVYVPPTGDDINKKYKLTSDQVLALGYGPISLSKFEQLLKDYQIKYSPQYKQVANTRDDERRFKRVMWGQYVSGPMAIRQYAKGTTGTKRDEFAITDEPQFGDELVLVPGKGGTLSFMRKGTGVVPADLTEELMELGQIGVDGLMNTNKFGANINMINNAVSKPQFTVDVENFLRVDRVDKDTLPQLEAMMDKKIDTFAKQLNYSIKKFSR